MLNQHLPKIKKAVQLPNLHKAREIIEPQPGPQTAFLSTPADVAIYGGAAGSGKTFAILMEALRNIDNPEFASIIFRRNLTDITKAGGLWDASRSLYHIAHGKSRGGNILDWTFPSGAKVQFTHLSQESDIYKFQGSQIPLIIFDELTHFTEAQFIYLASRNRSTCGVKPRIRATTNPDRDSWVRELLDWWIDDKGIAIPERSGKIRFFTRINDKIIWADSRSEILEYYNKPEFSRFQLKEENIRSFTFISASITDNKILLEKDRGYIASLLTLDAVEQARLLHGNWNITRSDIGAILSRKYFPRFDNSPKNYYEYVYMVVDSASKTKEANDYSVIGVFGRNKENFFILDWVREKLEGPELMQKIIDVKNKHSHFHLNNVFIEAGASGTTLSQFLSSKGIAVTEIRPVKDKFLRLNDVLGIIKNRNVHIPENANWINDFLTECEYFRADGKHIVMSGETKPHDDQVDVLAYGLSRQSQPVLIRAITRKPIQYERPELMVMF